MSHLSPTGAFPSLRIYGSTVYRAVITTTIIGYGDVASKTSQGRVLSGLLALSGIGLAGVPSSQLTTWLVKRKTEVNRTPQELEAIHREPAELRWLLETCQASGDTADHSRL